MVPKAQLYVTACHYVVWIIHAGDASKQLK